MTGWWVGTELDRTGRLPRLFAVTWAGRGEGEGQDQRLGCGPALVGGGWLGWGHGWTGTAGGGRQGQERGAQLAETGVAGLARTVAACAGRETPSRTGVASGLARTVAACAGRETPSRTGVASGLARTVAACAGRETPSRIVAAGSEVELQHEAVDEFEVAAFGVASGVGL